MPVRAPVLHDGSGVPLREAMELMRHSDVRLTMSVYTDSSLFALRPAVEKLPWNYLENDTQIDAQSSGAGGLLPSLPVTIGKRSESDKTIVDTEEKSLDGTLCHTGAGKMVRDTGFEPVTPTVSM
jgi:hypothetical protein